MDYRRCRSSNNNNYYYDNKNKRFLIRLAMLVGIMIKNGNAFVPTYTRYRNSQSYGNVPTISFDRFDMMESDSRSISQWPRLPFQSHRHSISMVRRNAQFQQEQSDDGSTSSSSVTSSSSSSVMMMMDQHNTTNPTSTTVTGKLNNNNNNDNDTNNSLDGNLSFIPDPESNVTTTTSTVPDPNRIMTLKRRNIQGTAAPTSPTTHVTTKAEPNVKATTIKKETAWSNLMDMLHFRKKSSSDIDGHLDYQGALLLSSSSSRNSSSSNSNDIRNNNTSSTTNTNTTAQSNMPLPVATTANNAIVLQNPCISNSNASPSSLIINTTNDVNNTSTNKNINNTSNSDGNTTNPAIIKRMSFQPKSFFSTWSYQPEGAAINTMSTMTIPMVATSAQQQPQPQQQQPPQFTIQDALANRNPDEVITVKDLQQILMATADGGLFMSNTAAGGTGTGRGGGKSTLHYPLNPIPSSSSSSSATGSMNSAASSPSSASPGGGGGSVAFPQMSVLTSRDLMIGTTLSSTVIGMLLGLSVLPNLWFVGGLLVGSWGYQLTRNNDNLQSSQQNLNILSELVLQIGRRVALTYLQIKDAINGIWFMYKTGQLSYTYYKQYASLDQRFAITDKVDAWNARFQQGKRAFDEWERENEIGRKVLATLRTVWLVEEERTSKQGRNSSNKRFMAMTAGGDGTYHRYRIVQYMYNIKYWFQTLARTVWNKLEKMAGGDWSDVANVLRGIRKAILSPRRQGDGDEQYGGLDEVVIRVGAALGAFVILNLVGAMFALWPNVLGLLAIVTGLVWPSWVSELRERLSVLLTDLRNQGASGGSYTNDNGGDENVAMIMGLGKQQFYDSSKYSYFQRRDGSKRWYRTGQSIKWGMTPQKNQPKKKSGILSFLQLPQSINKKKVKREPGKEQWGHFSRK